MKRTHIIWLLVVGSWGCGQREAVTPPTTAQPAKPQAASNKTLLAKNVYLQVQPDGRRQIHVPAKVCFREGLLEMLLCRQPSKEHESILTADIDARDLHQALLAAGAVAGTPVRFEPKYEPATGSPIRITLQYEEDGKTKTVNARDWIREVKTKKSLDRDWVFAGSFFFEAGEGAEKKRLYAANSGDIVCVSNFATAMMDLPIPSSAENEELTFEAVTDRIPPLGTDVTVIFEPVKDVR